jgi:hypothetical protein
MSDEKMLLFYARPCLPDNAILTQTNICLQIISKAYEEIKKKYGKDFTKDDVRNYFFVSHNKERYKNLKELERYYENKQLEQMKIIIKKLVEDHHDLEGLDINKINPIKFYKNFRDKLYAHLVIPYKIVKIKNSFYDCKLVKNFYEIPESLQKKRIENDEIVKAMQLGILTRRPKKNEIIVLHDSRIIDLMNKIEYENLLK